MSWTQEEIERYHNAQDLITQIIHDLDISR